MTPINRRDFLGGVLATGTTLATSSLPAAEAQQAAATPSRRTPKPANAMSPLRMNFRYAPAKRQTAFFSLISLQSLGSTQAGQCSMDMTVPLRFPIPLKIGFTLDGMQAPKVLGQQLESPHHSRRSHSACSIPASLCCSPHLPPMWAEKAASIM